MGQSRSGCETLVWVLEETVGVSLEGSELAPPCVIAGRNFQDSGLGQIVGHSTLLR